jgi:ubiquinone/menaquinone biosynthesis C-methylase UbiE
VNNFLAREFGNKAVGFENPVQRPRDPKEHDRWQAANKAWWESAPMRYDWREEISHSEGSEAYFAEIDRRFLSSARSYMPWQQIPFEAVIPFDDLRNKDVLEIGVGQGTHAQLLAPRCRSFTGIDLTNAAAEITAKRLKLFKISGTVLQMDAERLQFPDQSFDYVWSWGVIHHSADTNRALAEIHRVLRPGGKFAAMVYHRSWWSYYVFGLLRSVFLGRGHKRIGLHYVNQRGTDGALARYYTPHEWRAVIRDLFVLDSIRVYGLKSDVLPLPHGRLKRWSTDALPDSIARFLTTQFQMGSLLVAQMRKPESR